MGDPKENMMKMFLVIIALAAVCALSAEDTILVSGIVPETATIVPENTYDAYQDAVETVLLMRNDPHQGNGIYQFDSLGDSQWKLVRRVKAGNTWHPAKDQMTGTESYGTYNNDHVSDSTFSMKFDSMPCKSFLFATGDMKKWLITPKASVMGWYANGERTILKSSDNPHQYKARWYRRQGAKEDPWISIIDHGPAIGAGKLVYGENRFGGAHARNVLPSGNGANVFCEVKKKVKKDSACRQLASATRKEVKDNIKTLQTALDGMPKGKACESEGSAIIAKAEKSQKEAKLAATSADARLKKANAAQIDFGKFTMSQLVEGECKAFYRQNVFKKAKTALKKAKDGKKTADKGVKDAKKALSDAKKTVSAMVKKCKCKVKKGLAKEHEKMNANAKAANTKAWSKARHLECVLDGTNPSSCKVSALPTVKAVKLGKDMDKVCQEPLDTPKYLGCFKDNGHRDLKHGPKRYGYKPASCRAACPTYKFIALQNGGWCNCDNTYSSPPNTYPKHPDSQCNHGGKGQGGGWRNAVYRAKY